MVTDGPDFTVIHPWVCLLSIHKQHVSLPEKMRQHQGNYKALYNYAPYFVASSVSLPSEPEVSVQSPHRFQMETTPLTFIIVSRSELKTDKLTHRLPHTQAPALIVC